MKRRIALILALIFAFPLAGCADQGTQGSETGEANLLREEEEPAPPLKSPPTLTVTCGDQSGKALLGSYSWTYDNGDGTMTSVIACGSHPLSDRDLMTPISRGGSESIALDFTAEPTTMSVRCWSDRYANDDGSYEENYTTPACEDRTVKIPTDGSYIYEVTATWESGTAYYSFYIVD